jgi:hypothetical protein
MLRQRIRVSSVVGKPATVDLPFCTTQFLARVPPVFLYPESLKSCFSDCLARTLRAMVPLHGGIAQLVERQLCKLEVRGSNPLASTATAARLQFEI